MWKIGLGNKAILITGVAGFIGVNLAGRLLRCFAGIRVVGVDNMNSYYAVSLKEYRLGAARAEAASGLVLQLQKMNFPMTNRIS